MDSGEKTIRVYELCCPGGVWFHPVTGKEAVDATQKLKEAESFSEQMFDWAFISEAWLGYLGRAGLQNAIRCALNSADYPGFCAGWIAGAQAWVKIAEYDEAYEAQIQVWLRHAEREIEFTDDACVTARGWVKSGLADAQENAFRLMKLAAFGTHRDYLELAKVQRK